MFSTLLSSALLFYHVQVPVTDMHENPSVDSAIISQAIFSEEVQILHTQEDWIHIQMGEDGCSGWTRSDAILERMSAYADCTCVTPIVQVNRLAAHVYRTPSTNCGAIMTLPFESRLEAVDPFEDLGSPWITIVLPDTTVAYIQRGDVITDIHPIAKEELSSFSQQFLNLPYTQGGRSSFGYDSSGFIQMLYQQIGFSIPKRVIDQFHWEGFEEISLEELTPGDLIFWGQTASDIQHVGMYIGKEQFIHTVAEEQQPWLRISQLDIPFYSGKEKWSFVIGKRVK